MKNDVVLRLFSIYSDDLYRFALSYIGNQCEAEDIVQDVFVKLISKPLIIRPEQEKAYLLRMTANLCKDHLKSPKYKANVDIDTLGDVIGISVDYSKDDDLLFKALSQMNEIYRMPIYLHYYEGYSHKEIAGILKSSEATISKRISRGKEELRKRLEE